MISHQRTEERNSFHLNNSQRGTKKGSKKKREKEERKGRENPAPKGGGLPKRRARSGFFGKGLIEPHAYSAILA